jgi:hypothetical protein
MSQSYVNPPIEVFSKETVSPNRGSKGDHEKDAEGLGDAHTKSVIVIFWLQPTASVTIIPISEQELPVNISLYEFPFPAGTPSTYHTQLLPSGLEVFVNVTDRGEHPSVTLAVKLGCGKAFTVT